MRRRTRPIRPSPAHRLGAAMLALAAVMAVALTAPAAQAQSIPFPGFTDTTTDPNAPKQMLVRGNAVVYDYDREIVTLTGNVQLYFQGKTLQADKVVYDRKNKRVKAYGKVRVTEPTGNVLYAESADVTEDFGNGLLTALRVETPQRTQIGAAVAERVNGDTTIYRSGVYTACEACAEKPDRPFTWQVKSARIIHKQKEQTIYFEDATLEFLGVPVLYLPYFWAPDNSVKRKSGFLMPRYIYTSLLGAGVEVPYYFALAPNYDLTVTPRYLTRQGLLMQAEWRHQLMTGSYSIRAAGIFQQDKDAFIRTDGTFAPGYRDFRGLIATTGQFAINERWSWGWDITAPTDRTFINNYTLTSTSLYDITSQVYLVGQGDRSFFEARVMYFQGLADTDVQGRIPIIHPVIDYKKVWEQPVFGGELSFKANFTSLSRQSSEFASLVAGVNCYDPFVQLNPNFRNQCLMRGTEGTYSRFSAQFDWRRSFTDRLGQIWTPFASVRADFAWNKFQETSVTSQFIDNPNGDALIRAMPAVGLEYRWPFASVQSWGVQTLEPIAQLVIRPNETAIGRFPNEDAQSLVFDDTNLFVIDKYSGYDRIEGGGRLNAGIRYSATFNNGFYIDALFGQSFHLFGVNSFNRVDMANVGLDSGLETTRSDYVGRIYVQPTRTTSISMKYRLDERTFRPQRFDLEGRFTYDRITSAVLYTYLAEQPNLGIFKDTHAILGGAQIKLQENWSISGAVRYNITQSKIDATSFGLTYLDDCFALAMNYISDYSQQLNGTGSPNHKVLLRLSLRTIGETGFNTNVDNLSR